LYWLLVLRLLAQESWTSSLFSPNCIPFRPAIA
jgi:hypothetical protein